MINRLAIRDRLRRDERRIRLHRRHGRQLPADPRRPAHRRPRGVARHREDERVPGDRHEAAVLGGILRQGHHAGQRFTISDSMEDTSCPHVMLTVSFVLQHNLWRSVGRHSR